MIQSMGPKTLLGGIAMVLCGMALLAPSAFAAEPAPGYGQFAGCPSPEENAEIVGCLRTEITGGHLQMGSKNVSIKNPIVLSGGFNAEIGGFSATSKGGMTKVKQEVPGGIIGLTGLDWLVNFLGLEALKVYGVTELAGIPSNLSGETATIPIKIHLVNPVLGNNCYIGSASNPIILNLTTGTTFPPPPNKPITGDTGEVFFDEKEIAHLNDGIYVDNAFGVPGASGCVLTLLGLIPVNIDGLVNFQSGLPSPAGTNEVVQNFNAEIVESRLVYP